MKEKLYKAKQIISVIAFSLILSVMGMITGRPVMMIAYGGFFLLMSLIIFLILNRQNKMRHEESTGNLGIIVRKVTGVIMMILALVAPLIVALQSELISLPDGISEGAVVGIMLSTTVLFIVLLLLSIFFINDRGSTFVNRFIGYVIYIIAAAFPGLLMSKVDRSTMGIGSVYYVALVVLILAYNAKSMFLAKE